MWVYFKASQGTISNVMCFHGTRGSAAVISAPADEDGNNQADSYSLSQSDKLCGVCQILESKDCERC